MTRWIAVGESICQSKSNDTSLSRAGAHALPGVGLQGALGHCSGALRLCSDPSLLPPACTLLPALLAPHLATRCWCRFGSWRAARVQTSCSPTSSRCGARCDCDLTQISSHIWCNSCCRTCIIQTLRPLFALPLSRTPRMMAHRFMVL